LAYGSSKAAFGRASKSLATELGLFNIRVNGISPGLTITDMHDQMTVDARDLLINRTAFKRPASVENVADVALFLASDLSEYVTGQIIRVDGGMI
jgi:3-oxoacyl-[acyl-carrier protein] reductase